MKKEAKLPSSYIASKVEKMQQNNQHDISRFYFWLFFTVIRHLDLNIKMAQYKKATLLGGFCICII
jgi:hypothetical protein